MQKFCNMNQATLSLEEIELLGELLAQLPEALEPMEADTLDGFLTALCLLRHPPEIDEWMSLVFDLNGNAERLVRDKRYAGLRSLILRRGSELDACIAAKKPIDPILYAEDDADYAAALAPFADGFALACTRWNELLEEKNLAVRAALVGILRYTDLVDEDESTKELVEGIDRDVAFVNIDEALADLQACVAEIAEVTRA